MPKFSVVIAVANYSIHLDKIRKGLSKSTEEIEVIIVVSNGMKGRITQQHPCEKIYHCHKSGRGYPYSEGRRIAKGEIILFLHADTFLPLNWETHVSKALSNKKVVGGAFSLAFDTDHLYLRTLVFLSDMFFKLSGELWGDRAIFFRSDILKEQTQLLEVPIMEDVVLSRYLNKMGRVIMLKEKVITSSASFLNTGLLNHTLRIIKSRLWFSIGGTPKKIFEYYYS